MQVFRKFSRSVSAQVELLLTQIENQEASVSAAIHGLERGASRIRAQRLASERQIAQLRRGIEQAREQVATWKQRALGLRHDRETALECVRRMDHAEQQAKTLSQRLETEEQLQVRVAADLTAVEVQLQELRQRRATLISREARAEACSNVTDGDDIALVFERWEARIEQHEAQCPSTAQPVDSFAARFDQADEAARLNRALDRLFTEEDA
ncbi:MAG TPA: hypothetical protein VMF89_29130 [Polyangiales bacterium]|nr:hypothetical protein [Polyangiales bacterium]